MWPDIINPKVAHNIYCAYDGLNVRVLCQNAQCSMYRTPHRILLFTRKIKLFEDLAVCKTCQDTKVDMTFIQHKCLILFCVKKADNSTEYKTHIANGKEYLQFDASAKYVSGVYMCDGGYSYEYDRKMYEDVAPVLCAVMAGDLASLEELFRKDEALELYYGHSKHNPLYLACMIGSLECVKLLMGHIGTAPEDIYIYAIKVSVKRRHDAVYNFLVSKLNAEYNNSYIVYWAIKRNRFELLERMVLLSGLNEDADKPLLLMACEHKNPPETVEFLLDHGADVNGKTYNQYPAADLGEIGDVTALMHAAENNDLPTVKLLIDRGANVNARDTSGDMARHYAKQDSEVYNFLVSKGTK